MKRFEFFFAIMAVMVCSADVAHFAPNAIPSSSVKLVYVAPTATHARHAMLVAHADGRSDGPCHSA